MDSSKASNAANVGLFIIAGIALGFEVWDRMPGRTAPTETGIVTGGWTFPVILGACLLLGGAFNLAAALIARRKHNLYEDGFQETDESGQVKDFADVTVGELTDFFKNYPAGQAQKLLAPFVGQWIAAVTGKVRNSYPYGVEQADMSLLLTQIDGTDSTLLAGFVTPESSHVYGITGATVKISGQISAVEPGNVTLSRCKLLHVKPPVKFDYE